MKKEIPSIDVWLKEAKADRNLTKGGMYLAHNGVARETAKEKLRFGKEDASLVLGRMFSYDGKGVEATIGETYKMEDIYYSKVWLNEGKLKVGEDIMSVLIGGNIRPHFLCICGSIRYKRKDEDK